MNKRGQDCGIPFELLVDYREGRATTDASRQVQSHLASGCDACAEHMARLERLLSVLPEAQRVHAPEAAVERARALFRERFRAPARMTLLARLTLDSRGAGALSAARGEAQPRQILYETDEYDLDLWEESVADGEWYLIGQVLPKSGAGTIAPESAVLTSAEGTEMRATAEGDEFHLPSVRAGIYQLRLRLGDTEIYIPDVTVGR